MNRRAVLLGIAAVAAAATGVGVALRRRPDDPAASLWSVRLPRLGGGEVAFADLRGKPLLVNFWATWCPPCVTEMPMLARFHQERRAAGWQVVGIAVDQDEPVRRFVSERAIDFPIGMARGAGLDLARRLGNEAGGLPFTIAFGPSGAIVGRKLGALDEAILATWASAGA